jgi:predicted GIY-YIG superfamily endonuclease
MERRYREHCNGSLKCRYTRSYPPKEISACWKFQSDSASSALKLERVIKKLTRQQKESLKDDLSGIRYIMDKAGVKVNLSIVSKDICF